MKGNIDITTNGYWYDDKSLYLDEYEYETKEIIDFKSFETNFHLWNYEKNLVVGPPSDETARKILLEILDKVD